jgi:uncharacterized protein YebE (UPF0316 family)
MSDAVHHFKEVRVELFAGLPPWATALAVFSLRIVDVSLGTLRTIAVVEGRLKLSVLLGFFETLIWITAVAQVLTSVKSNPLILLAYCGGFAAGNAVGIQIDRRLALGVIVVRMFTSHAGAEIAAAIRRIGLKPTTFEGHGGEGPSTLIYVICPRREAPAVVRAAQAIDHEVYYSVDLVREYYGGAAAALPSASGWRAMWRKK